MVSGCNLGTWEITEELDQLLGMVELDEDEYETIHSFGSHNRKLEYLSVRILLQEMTGRTNRIHYTDSKKPYLENNSFQISISHSHKLTSILTSQIKRVGIDIEFMSHRIENIIHPREIITTDEENRRKHLYIHWCAKEALYKICDKGHLNFKYNLFIPPFEVSDQGQIRVIVHSKKMHEEFDLHFFTQNNYVFVMCCKE